MPRGEGELKFDFIMKEIRTNVEAGARQTQVGGLVRSLHSPISNILSPHSRYETHLDELLELVDVVRL